MNGLKLPGVWKTLVDAVSRVKGSSSNGQNYRMSTRSGRPFSAICWSTLEPVKSSIVCYIHWLSFMGEEPRAGSIIGANFTAGFVAGAATCPLDVAKTRRQIEKDRDRAMKMTTRQTLAEIWRYELAKGNSFLDESANTVELFGGSELVITKRGENKSLTNGHTLSSQILKHLQEKGIQQLLRVFTLHNKMDPHNVNTNSETNGSCLHSPEPFSTRHSPDYIFEVKVIEAFNHLGSTRDNLI
ncbi:hypothetical protein YC2023_022728 [Brassica napus]